MTRPSWQDFGTHDESAHPQLWDGVIGAWCPALGPTGSRLHDMSGRSNWGTLTGLTASSAWTINSGTYSLTSSTTANTDYVDCGTMQSDSLAYPFSMSCWIRNASVSPDGSPFSKIQNTDGFAGAMIWIDGSVAKAYWSGGARASGTSTVTGTSLWTHVAICWTGTQARVIVNGRVNGTGSTTTAPNAAASSVNILRYGTSSGRGMSGDVTDCIIWRRCLTANEWADLYQLGIAGMYERKRRTIRRLTPEQAGFRPYWALQRNQTIGGGLR
jgi:hypothetical protein